MTVAGERVPLETFLEEITESDVETLERATATFRDQATDLLRNLSDHEDLRAQTQKLLTAIPSDLSNTDVAKRAQAAREAEHLISDLKSKWINADAPPLVAEIDERFADFRKELSQIAQSSKEQMREAANKIDRLSLVGKDLEGIERRFVPWAYGAGLLFLVGLWGFFSPSAVNRWIAAAMLSAPPLLALLYIWRVRDRTNADREAEELNKTHFLPHGGLYFAPGENPACVVRVTWSPPPPETSNPRKKPVRAGRSW